MFHARKSFRFIALSCAFLFVSAFSSTALSQVTVTSSGGTPNANYTTVDGAFTAINAGTHTGAVTIDITANTTETGPAVLNSSGAGAASYTSVLIRPTVDGVTIAGPTTTGRGLIELNGADNVTIDGDNPNTAGTNRNLTITNTAANTVAYSSVIRIALATTIVTSADNNTFKNLILNGNATGRNVAGTTSTIGSENTTYGVLATGGASTVSATTAPTAIASATTTIGAGATASNLTVDNNSVISVARGVAVQGSATTVFPDLTITNNLIGNATAGAADQVYSMGATAQGSTNAVLRGNTVYVESFVATALRGLDVGSISSAASSGFTFERNMVNRVRHNGASGAYGINLGGGSTHTVRNNFVSGVITGTSGFFSTTSSGYGIRVASGTGHFIYHNSVNLYGTVTGTTLALSTALGFTSALTTGVDARNNILVNTQSGGASTSAFVSLFFSSSTLTSAYNLTLNNNDYYIGAAPTANNGYGQAGTTAGTGFFTTFDATTTTPASNLRSYTSTLNATGTNDNASKAVDPQFVSASDLHINAASPMVDMGADVGVTNDIDGKLRPGGNAFFDIGADEFDGTTAPANDIAATAIVTPVTGSAFVVGSTVTPQATFTNVGSATQTGVQVTFTISGPGGYTYSNTQTIATIAPNQTVTVTFAAAPAFTTAGSYATTATVTTPDANTANDTITGSFTVFVQTTGGSVNVGSAEAFTSLTNPGGIFDSINNSVVTSNITVNITSDLTGETGARALNEIPGGFTVTIKPSGAARTVSGSASAALIKLNGADNVVFDGSTSGGTDRSLTIANTNTGISSAVIWIASASATDGATNNTVKNTIVTGNATTTTLIGIFSGGTTTISATSTTGNALTANSNNTIQNNQISKSQYGIVSRGTSTTTLDLNLQIIGNAVGVAGAGSGFNTRGIYLVNQDTATVRGNEIQNASNSTTATDMAGIYQTDVKNNIISENKIHSLSYTGTSTGKLYGIHSSSPAFDESAAASKNTFVNNAVYNLTSTATSTSWNVSGIVNFAGYGDQYYFNSVSLTGQMSAGTGGSAAFSVGTGLTTATATSGGFDIRNNIFSMTGSSTAAAKLYAHYVRFATPTNPYTATTLDYNDLYVVAGGLATGHIGFYTNADRTTLADWKTATGQEVNSLSADPLFVSATDLHIQAASPARNVGTPISVTVDFDGQARPNPFDSVVQVDIGADEFYAPVAAQATLSGRVTTANGAGIRNAIISISGGDLPETRYSRTSSFGYYAFEDLTVGQTYIVMIQSKRYTFTAPTRVVQVNDNIDGVDFVAEP